MAIVRHFESQGDSIADVTIQTTAWRQGYEAALRDLEQHVPQVQEPGAARLAGVLAELHAGLASGHRRDPTATETAGIPAEDLQREWTAG